MFKGLFGKKRLKALVVEDEPRIRQLIGKHLEMQELEVHSAENGQEAFETLATMEPDILLTDLNMPKMSGVELIREFRKINPDTRIIVYTGNDNPDVKQLAMDAGADMFILKPGPVKKLELAVVKFCGGAQEPE